MSESPKICPNQRAETKKVVEVYLKKLRKIKNNQRRRKRRISKNRDRGGKKK